MCLAPSVILKYMDETSDKLGGQNKLGKMQTCISKTTSGRAKITGI